MRFFMENKAATPEHATSNTSVWWDIDSCPVPAGYNPTLVGPSIRLALEKLGYRGPITITAVGKLKRTSLEVLQALSASGIFVKYGARHDSTYAELLYWQASNPPPSTIMFISSSSVLECLSHRLHFISKRYNMLLAYRSRPALPIKGPELFTSTEWRWKTLLKDNMEAREQILMETGKYGSFTCTLCYSAWQSVEEFTTHLEGVDHEVIKFGLRANPAYLDTLSQDTLEKELEKLKKYLNEEAVFNRRKKVTTKLVKRTTHFLAKKIQWEELKKKLEERGQSASQVQRERKKRFERLMKKYAYERAKSSRRKNKAKKMKREQLKKKLEEGGQSASQVHREKKKRYETSRKRKFEGAESSRRSRKKMKTGAVEEEEIGELAAT